MPRPPRLIPFVLAASAALGAAAAYFLRTNDGGRRRLDLAEALQARVRKVKGVRKLAPR